MAVVSAWALSRPSVCSCGSERNSLMASPASPAFLRTTVSLAPSRSASTGARSFSARPYAVQRTPIERQATRSQEQSVRGVEGFGVHPGTHHASSRKAARRCAAATLTSTVIPSASFASFVSSSSSSSSSSRRRGGTSAALALAGARTPRRASRSPCLSAPQAGRPRPRPRSHPAARQSACNRCPAANRAAACCAAWAARRRAPPARQRAPPDPWVRGAAVRCAQGAAAPPRRRRPR